MEIVYLNLAADSEPFISHMKSQQRTWADDVQSTAIWIFGSSLNVANYDEDTRRLELPVEEKFENILEKSVLGIEWALRNMDFDYIVRGNTSNYYDDVVLKNYLAKKKRDKDFVGSELGFAEQNSTTLENAGLYLSGTGIVLSREAAKKMLDLDSSKYLGWPDDVAISHHLSNHGLKFTRIPRGDITDFKPLMFTTQYRVKSWTDHSHTSQRMWEVDKILKKPFLFALPIFLKFTLIEYFRYARYFPVKKGLNSLRHVRQIMRITKSLLLFPWLKWNHTRIKKKSH